MLSRAVEFGNVQLKLIDVSVLVASNASKLKGAEKNRVNNTNISNYQMM